MAWFRKEKKPLKAEDRRDLPGDVFEKCSGCSEILYKEKLAENAQVCPHCGAHFRISAPEYVALFIDEGSFSEIDANLTSGDPLGFRDLKAYPERMAQARAKVGRENGVMGFEEYLETKVMALQR